MKNVTGLDLCRGLAGSWGTLAVMCEVTFKVQPMPEETATLVMLGLPDEIAVEVLCEAMTTPYEVSGAVHLQHSLVARLWYDGLREQGQAVTALRLENFAKSVAYRKARLMEHLKAYGEIHELDSENSLAFWGELRQLSVLQRARLRSGAFRPHRRRAPGWSPPSPPTCAVAPSTTGPAAWSGPKFCPRPTLAPPTSVGSLPCMADTPR